MAESMSGFLQENLLVLISYNEEQAKIICNDVSPDLYVGEYRSIATEIYQYIHKYGKPPGDHIQDLFEEILNNDKDRKAKAKARFYRTILNEIRANRTNVDVNFTMDKLGVFVSHQTTKKGVLAAAEILEGGHVGEEEIERVDQILKETRDLIADPRSGELNGAVLNLEALVGRKPPKRRFAVMPLVPARVPTLLHGFGGTGKSLLAQQMATSYVMGLDLFECETEGRPALFLSGEDDKDEVWRRQIKICRRLGVELEDLVGKLDLVSAPHIDLTLARVDERSGKVTTTRMWDWLRERIEERKHGLVIFDNSAKVFVVKEGDRIGITRCVELLSRLGYDFKTTSVLIAHDNKEGDYSGSTAWENACRSRLHLRRNGEGLVLELPKANYADPNTKIELKWDSWSFVSTNSENMTREERKDAKAEQEETMKIFLGALDKLRDQGLNVSDKKRAPNYAPKVMVDHRLAKRKNVKQLHEAMITLLNRGEIQANAPLGTSAHRNKRYGLARVDGGEEDDE